MVIMRKQTHNTQSENQKYHTHQEHIQSLQQKHPWLMRFINTILKKQDITMNRFKDAPDQKKDRIKEGKKYPYQEDITYAQNFFKQGL